MVWNKTPEDTVNKIIQALQDTSKHYKDVAKEFEVSEWLVSDIARKHLSKDLLKQSYSSFCSKSKQGNKNPMFGLKGHLHHNSVDVVRVAGYKTVFAPSWWLGKTVKSGRMYAHHYMWAVAYNQVEFPHNCVLHHIDLNIDNNSIENLQLMTISEHIKLHTEIRKVQRLSSNGVGNSVPEAHNIP